MGNNLGAVPLGADTKVKSVAVHTAYCCAILDDGSVRCWGYNDLGRLGIGSNTTNVAIGDETGEMAALKPLDLGSSGKAVQLALGTLTFCVLLDSGEIKCWGSVNLPAPDVLGDDASEMGDKLPVVPIEF